MNDEALLGPPRIRRRLAALDRKPLNFDLASLPGASPATGWAITDLCQALPPEQPGPPEPDRSWEIARRLMSGYEFADPSIVRAYYDPRTSLEGRNMLLRLRALRGLAVLSVGVRVGDVYDETRRIGGEPVRVWGWNYRTLEGHVEAGQMDWEVWKWTEDGRVEFRVHAISRPAPIANPIVRLGFHLLRGRERRAFLESTKQRMLMFTRAALERERPGAALRDAGPATARPAGDTDAVHETLARRVEQS